MKTTVFVLMALAVLSANAVPSGSKNVATPCSPECVLPKCHCSDTEIPGGLSPSQTPQFVLLTFDDAVGVGNIHYYREALYHRTNPDSCPIQATYFISHEYTDYTLVHELHSKGMEIALHSISHEAKTTYWKDADVALLEKELAEQRMLMAYFSKITIDEIKGIRMPFLQMAGNRQFEMFQKHGFLYDLSWPTQSHIQPGLWPYTLDHRSDQDCVSGPPCPTDSFPGTWVIPMIMWRDTEDIVCAMADACVNIPDTETELTNWMIREFNRQYNGNRAPFGFYVHAAWFDRNSTYFAAYNRFLDYLGSLDDVFISSASKVIDWVKKPVPWQEMIPKPGDAPKCPNVQTQNCVPRACQLCKEGTQERWMTSCERCPNSYPWLGNQFGRDQISCPSK